MRKIFAGIVLALMICSCASADIIYSTEDGSLGVVRIPSQTSPDLKGIQYEGDDDDTFLGSYWDGSSSKVILVSRTTDYTESGDTALIFNPGNLASPVDSEPKILYGVYNTQAISGTNNGRGLYFASGRSIREFNTETFARERTYIRKTASDDEYQQTIKSVATSTYTVFGLVDYTESKDRILMFDGQLRDDVQNFGWRTPELKISAMSYLNSGRLAVADDEGVSVLSGSSFVKLVSSDYPVVALCTDNDQGFYFAEEDDDGTVFVKHFTGKDNEEAETLYSEVSESECRLAADNDTGVLGVIIAEKLLIFSMEDDTLTGEYDSSDLGGTPRHIVNGTASGDSSSSSSGCNAFGTGMLLLGCALLMKRR